MIKMQIDPRIKLLSMVLISFIALTGTTTGHAVYPRLVIILIPTFCLLYLHYYKTGLLCFFILFTGWYIETFQLRDYHAVVYSLIFIIANLLTRFLPAVLMGFVLFKTTSVEMFIRALEKLKFPNVLTIPLAVMFRFLPVVYQESQNIKHAMRMRGMTTLQAFLHPIRYTEMRIVPLINRVVKISNELTAASLTRGLSVDAARTSLIVFKMTAIDKTIAGLLILLVILYYVI